jgi:hypothetical protein
MRYVLHQLKEVFEKEVKSTMHENALAQINSLKEKDYTFKFSKKKICGVEELATLEKKPSIIDKMNGYGRLYDEANQDIPGYFDALEDYCKKTAAHAAYVKGYLYISEFVAQFDIFFNTFVYKVKEKLVNGEKLTREEKDRIVSSSHFNKGLLKYGGWCFSFTPYMKTYLVKQYDRWEEYKAFDKTSLRKILYGTIQKIVEITD